MKSTTKPDIDYEITTYDTPAIKNILSDPDKRKDVKIFLKIAGGVPSQRYNFDLSLAGDGEIYSRYKSETSEQYGEEKSKISEGELENLFDTIVKGGILNVTQSRPLFLPDTVVGLLTIIYYDQTYSVYFAADEDQADVQNMKTPPQVKEVIDTLYSIGSKVLKLRSIKP